MIVNGQPHAANSLTPLGGSTKRLHMIVIAIAFVAGFGVKQLLTAALSRSGSAAAMFFVKFGPS
jgi:hypothetical protein